MYIPFYCVKALLKCGIPHKLFYFSFEKPVSCVVEIDIMFTTFVTRTQPSRATSRK